MSTTARIFGFQLRDVARSRWLFAYAGFFYLATDALLRFGDAHAALVSLMNVVLIIVPLVTVVFGTMYVYNAREFTELMLAQPVNRRQFFAGLYLGLALPLAGALSLGIALPLLVHGASAPSGALTTILVAGAALSAVFTALACVIATWIEDKVRGLAAAIGVWLLLAVLYDGAVLFLALRFADYPVERGLLALMLANPVDLARILLLLEFDISALMGYTGAVFKSFFGSIGGTVLAAFALALWIAAPIGAGFRLFQRKDF
jgi:Cu-processing system permease protein